MHLPRSKRDLGFCMSLVELRGKLYERITAEYCVGCQHEASFLRRVKHFELLAAVQLAVSRFPAGVPSNSLTNLQWSERATAVMSFLVLLAGALGGVQCLTHMNFKRDTLLFGSAKSD